MKEYYVKVDKLDEYSNTGSHISGYTVPIGKYEDDIEARTGFWDWFRSIYFYMDSLTDYIDNHRQELARNGEIVYNYLTYKLIPEDQL